MMTYYMGEKQSFFLIFSFVTFFAGYFSLYYFYRPVKVKTPNLVGLALSDALSLVTSLECSLCDYGEAISDQYSFPTVVAQDPSPFDEIRVGQTIFVKVGKPELPQRVPSFLGKTEAEIQALADKSSLYVHVKPVFYQGARDLCCGQFPQAGLLLSDQCIIVYIAKPAEGRFVMPSLVKRTYQEVELFLMQHSMVLRAHDMNQAGGPVNRIVNQIPQSGVLVSLKSGFVVDVQLTVNKGL